MLTRRHPSDIQDSRLIAVLGKFVPPIIARSIVERARREAASGPEVSWTDPNGLLDRISVGVRLFAAPDQQAAILREITDLAVADYEAGAPQEEISPSSSSALRPPSVRPRNEDAPTAPAARRDAPQYGPPQPVPAAPPPPPTQHSNQVSSRRDFPPASRREHEASYPASRAPVDYGGASRGVFSTSGGRTTSPSAVRPYVVRPPTNAAVTMSSAAAAVRPDITPGRGDITPATGISKVAASSPPSSKRGESSREITIVLTTEHDIPRARQVAREICEALGTRALTQQRLVTIVSELGRNMVLYAGGGQITLRPPLSSNRRVLVMAVDHGPGIANLPEILAGKYKSRSGLGLGIVGTKRLADSFHIETGRHGTEIRVEVIV